MVHLHLPATGHVIIDAHRGGSWTGQGRAEKGEGRAWSGQYWVLFLESLIVVVVLFVA